MAATEYLYVVNFVLFLFVIYKKKRKKKRNFSNVERKKNQAVEASVLSPKRTTILAENQRAI